MAIKEKNDPKQYYISQLIQAGVYKAKGKQLYELRTSELKQMCKKHG